MADRLFEIVKNLISLISLAAFSILFFSCKKEADLNSNNSNHYSYFPLENGSWVIYKVDSIVHNSDDDFTNNPDTSISAYHFLIKEVIDSSFVDGQGNTAYRVSRYRRLNDTIPWEFQAVWVAVRTFNSAQRVEDNIRYLKLSFPVSLQSNWNGNAFNDFSAEDYAYTDIHVPSTFGSLSFDSTVTVLQLQDDNLIHRIFKQEVYANHVGLVYKQKDSLNINGIGQVTNGIEFREIIQSYGH
jgi:hypothetical protein